MELRFMKECDKNEKILKWSSEEIVIPYISPIDNKKHRYFPDFLIQTTKGWFLIEVKPQIQTKPPKKILMEKVTLKKKRRYLKAVRLGWSMKQNGMLQRRYVKLKVGNGQS